MGINETMDEIMEATNLLINLVVKVDGVSRRSAISRK